MGKWIGMGLLLASLVGCGNEAAETMGGGGPSATWEALDKFQQEPQMSIAYPGEMGDWAAAKRAAAGEQFQAAVAEFEQSPLPDAYSGKQAAKDSAVAALKELIEAGKSGTPQDVQAKYEAAAQQLAKLRE